METGVLEYTTGPIQKARSITSHLRAKLRPNATNEKKPGLKQAAV
jgi:hypothetical protein